MIEKSALNGIPELAKYTGMSVRKLRVLAKENELPGRKIGGKWIFSIEAVEKWIRGDDNENENG